MLVQRSVENGIIRTITTRSGRAVAAKQSRNAKLRRYPKSEDSIEEILGLLVPEHANVS